MKEYHLIMYVLAIVRTLITYVLSLFLHIVEEIPKKDCALNKTLEFTSARKFYERSVLHQKKSQFQAL